MTPFANPRDWFRNELRNFFRDFTGTSPGRGGRWPSTRSGRDLGVFPAVNIYDNGEGFRIRAELPGVDSDDLEINAKPDQIELRGERTIAPPEEDANWHRREREGGSFRRVVNLPKEIDPDGVSANLKFGVLDIFAPRSNDERPRQIEIE